MQNECNVLNTNLPYKAKNMLSLLYSMKQHRSSLPREDFLWGNFGMLWKFHSSGKFKGNSVRECNSYSIMQWTMNLTIWYQPVTNVYGVITKHVNTKVHFFTNRSLCCVTSVSTSVFTTNKCMFVALLCKMIWIFHTYVKSNIYTVKWPTEDFCTKLMVLCYILKNTGLLEPRRRKEQNEKVKNPQNSTIKSTM